MTHYQTRRAQNIVKEVRPGSAVVQPYYNVGYFSQIFELKIRLGIPNSRILQWQFTITNFKVCGGNSIATRTSGWNL